MSQQQLEVVTWGESMLRLSPPQGASLENTHSLEVWVGGTESNMAAALARLGRSTGWVSRLPENALGRRIASEIARHGVDTSRVIWAGESDRFSLDSIGSIVLTSVKWLLYSVPLAPSGKINWRLFLG